MYVTADQFWQAQVVLSAIEADLRAQWAVEVFGLAVGLSILVVLLLNVLRRR